MGILWRLARHCFSSLILKSTVFLIMTFLLLDLFLFSVKDDLNFTFPQVEPSPDNDTIQSFVRDYVEGYVGMYNLTMS